MGKWLLGLSILVMGSVMVATEADAKRLGGGRSVGTQRSVTAPPAATPAKPAQQQTAPAAQPASRWGMLGGILGGLALGGLLGYMFGGNGLAGMLMLALLAVGVVFLVRALMRRRAEQQPMQLAGMGNETVSAPPPSQNPAQSLGGGVAPVSASRVPAGFDTASFLRAAKLNFIKLQVANDSGRVDELREFTTPELFQELRADIQASGQQTDVVTLNADLLEVASEKNSHWASVRFSGMVRETPGTEPVGFEEVWNLVKPGDGSTGWLLAGIQQMH
ncbi:MAG TPA: Tim44-like domain-containing protein [Burkholderiales bacterium]|nr:Tim44-like domain-containing protein [Burkholderiales bacterium]